ncbi:hypothetical protein KCP74_11515 [Salmonella enterica subsp. enterica]|nr:hypothetical protein KCP74_11515 [Salmonella enterica subsp. enterica]
MPLLHFVNANIMPCCRIAQSLHERGRGGVKPPSRPVPPQYMALLSSGAHAFLKMRSMLAIASSSLMLRSAGDVRARQALSRIKPIPAEYGCTFPVRERWQGVHRKRR